MIMKKAAFSSKKTMAHPSVQNGGERESEGRDWLCPDTLLIILLVSQSNAAWNKEGYWLDKKMEEKGQVEIILVISLLTTRKQKALKHCLSVKKHFIFVSITYQHRFTSRYFTNEDSRTETQSRNIYGSSFDHSFVAENFPAVHQLSQSQPGKYSR